MRYHRGMSDYSHKNPIEVEKHLVRRTQAMEMKAEGATFQQIADALGYANKGHAWKDINKRLSEVKAEEEIQTEHLRVLHETRLERLIQAWWPQATGQDVNRPGLNSRAAEIVLKCMERQAKLRGVDAPVKSEVTVTQNLDQRIEEMLRILSEEGPDPQVIEGELVETESAYLDPDESESPVDGPSASPDDGS